MVPNGWEFTTFEHHIDLLSGFAFKSAQYTENSDDIRLLRGDNIAPNTLRWDGVKTWDKHQYAELQKYHLRENDFVIAMDRTWVSSGLKVAEVTKNDLPCLLVQRVARIRSLPTLEQSLLRQYFSSHRFEQYVKGVQTETAVPHISSKQIKEFPLLLPPLPEQRKIAQILSTWDRGIVITEKLIDASKQQKKALMQQLLTGKKRLVDPETGKAFEGDWENTHLSNIASIKKGKALSAKNLVAGSYPVIAGGKSSPYSHVDFTHENVITVSASGAYAGYVSYHPYKIWASDCSVVTAKPANYLGFIFQWLQLNQIRIYSMQSGGAQPHIYPKDLEVMRLRVPKIEEQEKIASVLTAADKDIELLEAKLAHFRQEKKALMQQLLTGKRRVKVAETEVA
ncbi:restriction endonuclease subunit S (plasmid) [Vibrio alginolyticus]|uniref:restriction endonuclease subunit S n=1 Tax=Vibrio harveyi group TaxID=717610 RepID=UPI000CE9A841|nr:MULTISPECIES: restriction endonuclease subunit S [Vibrio harveyi group]AVF73926.1 restriction endonuclease subunit S [Vibrio alginolyticus]MCS0322635.1 restriction endonuclease subunit S [Vibrio diabolicus]